MDLAMTRTVIGQAIREDLMALPRTLTTYAVVGVLGAFVLTAAEVLTRAPESHGPIVPAGVNVPDFGRDHPRENDSEEIENLRRQMARLELTLKELRPIHKAVENISFHLRPPFRLELDFGGRSFENYLPKYSQTFDRRLAFQKPAVGELQDAFLSHGPTGLEQLVASASDDLSEEMARTPVADRLQNISESAREIIPPHPGAAKYVGERRKESPSFSRAVISLIRGR